MSQNRNPDELAQYLDELLQSAGSISPDEIDDPLAEVAMQLAQDTPPKLDTAMRARMREKVQQAHHTRTTSKRTIQFPTQTVLRWVAVLAIFVVLLNNVAVPAMADSLPGDALYPVKLAIESVELGLTTSDEIRADVYIRQAERRIEEAQRLLDADIVNTQLITQAINNLSNADQLVTDTSTTHRQIVSVTDHTVQFVAQVAERDPESAAELYVQLADMNMTSAQIAATEEPDTPGESQPIAEETVEPTDIPTETPQPTETDTPTDVPTETPEPTETDSPTDTPEPAETDTPEPSPTETEEVTPIPTYESYIGVVSATANVNIRELPTTDSEIVEQVAPGTIVTVIGESVDGEWLQISVDDEIEGWIAYTLIVEGTVPQFTAATETIEETVVPQSDTSNVDAVQTGSDTGTSSDNNSNSSTNQGNDGINKFGCDGQGNSCNASDQSSNNSNNNKDKDKK